MQCSRIVHKNKTMLVLNGTVICPDRIIEDGAVYIKDALIADVGASSELKRKYKEAEIVEGDGGIIMPGLINAHMHFYSSFARGMPSPHVVPTNFVEVLERIWWKLDKQLTSEDIYYSALVALIDCLKCGTTTIIDHHASPYALEGSLDLIAKAVKTVGLRACLCYEVSDRDGTAIANAGIAENVRFIRQHKDDHNLSGMMGLHASFTISDRTLERAASEATNLGVGCHIHVAEDRTDVEDCRKKHKIGVIERLHRSGILSNRSIAAHCVHITHEEMELLKGMRCGVVHNPYSNMNNAVGCAPVVNMFEKGVLIGLGTDGMSSDMFLESKFASVVHKHTFSNPAIGFVEAYSALVKNNPDIASRFFPKKVGCIEKGAYADIIILDYKAATPLIFDNFASHLLFGLTSANVVTTIASGRVLMRNRKILHLDEEEIFSKAAELAGRLWERM